ncbi:HD domain-containing protein [Glutamicibacter sp. NPDC127525]|uniref:HD domain-containing protein n=1 Tax=unclassified Glutamicibacter TaxID=2627139 RepID=UPI0036320FCC
MTKLEPAANHYGRDVSNRIGSAGPALFEQYPLLDKLWEDAKQLLAVRSNDAHTLYSVSLAQQLLGHHPQADANIVLPAMLLHDIGWSAVDPALVLGAIAPGAGNAELVLQHEKEGAKLARRLLAGQGVASADIERIVFIIDGHDSRKESTSIEDSLVKDADKLWRLTGHGLDTIMDWFGLTRSQAFTLVESRVAGHLSTEQARSMASGFIAVERANMLPQRLLLDGR